jgi:cobalamin biosynthetic protein CobC
MRTFTIHGGRLGQARALFPHAATPWIDLSTGISPLPYPADFTNATRSRLPDPVEIAALEAAAARAFGIDASGVLATAGAEAAIRLLASTLDAGTVAVVQPTYSGHLAAWRQTGAVTTSISRDDLDTAAEVFDVVVVVNPNNPDGAVLPPARLLALGEKLTARDGWLIVDEAFVEAAPDISLATSMTSGWSAERVIALRSFGKFYGLPGVRLGFVTAHPDVIERLRSRLGEWPVSAEAITAGLQAYADPAWRAAARRRLADGAVLLDEMLARSGFEVVGGVSLFRLATARNVAERFRRLAEAGVLTRPFSHAPNWLRIGQPAPEQWPRLEAALMEIIS